jgi:nicotinamidase-related amidase
VVSEQYPKGLGATIARLREFAPTPIEKMTFSCVGEPRWMAEISRHKRPNIILAGIESHVCVQQTAFDVLGLRRGVALAADAVSSRRQLDLDWSLTRMSRAGVEVTTAESIIFEWLEVAGTADFKTIAPWVKSL